MNDIVSYTAFKWILTILTGGLAGSWLVYDAYNLLRLRREDPMDPQVGDKRFGYLVGIAVGVIGILGCLMFHDVI